MTRNKEMTNGVGKNDQKLAKLIGTFKRKIRGIMETKPNWSRLREE